MIKAGKWGKLKISYGYCCKPRVSIGFEHASPPPSNVHWNLWRGPAVIHQFHNNYVHYDWHWFWLRVMEISTTKAPTNSMSQDGH